MSTLLKKPRFSMRCWVRRSLEVLKASPSDDAELAADDLVQGAHVAGDVDAVDIDARALPGSS